MQIIDGKAIATEVIGRLKDRPMPKKFLAAILVGDDKSSISFLKQKEKVAEALGVDFRLFRFLSEITNDELRREVGKIAAHKTCGGIIVQLPLGDAIDPHYILNAIPSEKDVDVLSARSLGSFYADRGDVLPPAVGAVSEILSVSDSELATRSVAIVGLGLLVGRPVANWMMRRAKETFCLRSTSDLGILKMADVVILGVGKTELVTPAMLKAGAGVIDFGYGTADGRYAGDFDARNGEEAAKMSFYTPTPGGTGPILVAKLFENFYKLNS